MSLALPSLGTVFVYMSMAGVGWTVGVIVVKVIANFIGGFVEDQLGSHDDE